jgi:DNA-binding winged helix-turn-helix (wHTH) protein/tetratricopeptide (TPR) repeat protein/TolB-like protein
MVENPNRKGRPRSPRFAKAQPAVRVLPFRHKPLRAYNRGRMPSEAASSIGPGEAFRLGEWLVQPSLNRISQDTQTVLLEPRTMDVLAYLARNVGRVVPREEIIEAVWQRHFVADATLSHAIGELRRALGDEAQQPRYIETIPKRGYRLIADVGEPLPEAEVTPLQAHRGFRAPLRVGVGALIAIAALAVAYGLLARHLRSRGTATSPVKANRIIVAVLENRTGDARLDVLGQMAADWVTQGLSMLEKVEVIPFASMVAGPAAGRDRAEAAAGDLARLASELHAGMVVSGSYYLSGETLEFQLRVVDATTGKLLAAPAPVSGSTATPMVLIEDLRERAMSAVATQTGPAQSPAWINPSWDAVRRQKPPRFDAYSEYLAGQALFGSDNKEAARHFRSAAELDPEFPAPLLVLEGLLWGQRNYIAAQEVLDRVELQRDRLTPFELEVLGFKQQDLRGNPGEALRHLRQALKISPADDVIRGLVGWHELQLGRPTAALQTWDSMNYDRWRGHQAWFLSIALFSEADHLVGNFESELEIARRAVALYPSHLGLRVPEVRALAAIGSVAEIGRVLETAKTRTPGRVTASTLATLAVAELRAHGHREASLGIAAREVSWLLARPEAERGAETHLHDLGSLLFAAGRWRDAEDVFRRLVERDALSIDYRLDFGVAAARAGDRDEALRTAEWLAKLDRPYLFGQHVCARACIAASLGEAKQSVDLLREALTQGMAYSVDLHSELALEPLWDFAEFGELIRPKG